MFEVWKLVSGSVNRIYVTLYVRIHNPNSEKYYQILSADIFPNVLFVLYFRPFPYWISSRLNSNFDVLQVVPIWGFIIRFGE